MNKKAQLIFTITLATALAITGLLAWARPSQAANVQQQTIVKPGAQGSAGTRSLKAQ